MPIRLPSVHLQTTIRSSTESAVGYSQRADSVDIALLHRQGPAQQSQDTYRLTATATTAGLLLLSLRKVLDDGSTVLLYRQDEGRERDVSEHGADWGMLAPPPETPRKR